jgi:hypothetical protein
VRHEEIVSMSTENDVPLGEGSRRYYEQLFGERVRQVKKGGSAPKPNSGSSNANGRAGCGTAIAILIAIRLIAAVLNTHSHTSSYTVHAPPPPRFNGAPFADNHAPEDEAMQRLRQLLDNRDPFQLRPDEAPHEIDITALLTKDDVPLLEGLCYRLYREHLHDGATPGKHLWTLLDPDVRPLCLKAVQGLELDANERQEVLDGLNEVLQDDKFWDPAAFAKLRQSPEFDRLRAQVQHPNAAPLPRVEDRRLVLQLCYPRQIVPLNERNKLDAPAREAWRRRAQLDLDEARREDKDARR